jgi:membrane-associated phospholipid phosphatase
MPRSAAIRLLRPSAAAFLLCVVSHEAAAQIPFNPPQIERPGAPGGGVDIPPRVAEARTPSPEVMPAFRDLFAPLPGDFRRLISTPGNLAILGAGGAGAIAGHHWDDGASSSSWGDAAVFAPGKVAGDFLVQTGGAVATYAIGHLTHSPRVARIGAEVFRAQIVSQATAQAIKFSAGRTRPDGTAHSFPSGHSASAFATAAVVQREFGWKAGIPAYAAATWVASSRVQMKRHYVSDVIAGATLGIMAGRSVTVGAGSVRFSVDPMPVAGGMGVSFTKVTRK